MQKLTLTATLLLCLIANPSMASIDDFIDELVSKHGFDRKEIGRTLRKAKLRQPILDAISRPAEAKPWWQYRKIFLTDKRIQGGVEFWRQNEKDLKRAEEVYGVPPEIITAIIGVETFYGRHTGTYPVLDALYTLGFHYPKRASFFRKQLGEFLLLTREEKMNPLKPMGSYAGAMGKPQFIPSSYRHYAIDFDGDGKRDIWHNNTDVIGSVANYFAVHNWQPGQPVATLAKEVSESHTDFIKAGMKPSLKLSKLEESGVNFDKSLDKDELASLIEFDLEEGKEHWLGLNNFYVITRYNHSNLYAMAVYQLSQEILTLREQKSKS